MEDNHPHPETRDPRTYAIIGAAMEVHRELGPGFLEAVYHEALDRELAARAIPTQREVAMPIRYKGQLLGTPYRADFVCFNEVVIELKAQRFVGDPECAQVINYLKAGNLETGLLVNFGEESLRFQRFVSSQRSSAKSAKSAAALGEASPTASDQSHPSNAVGPGESAAAPA